MKKYAWFSFIWVVIAIFGFLILGSCTASQNNFIDKPDKELIYSGILTSYDQSIGSVWGGAASIQKITFDNNKVFIIKDSGMAVSGPVYTESPIKIGEYHWLYKEDLHYILSSTKAAENR